MSTNAKDPWWKTAVLERSRGRWLFPWMSLNTASSGAGRLFCWHRFYADHWKWSPIILLWRRYPWRSFYNGTFPCLLESNDVD